MRYFNQGRFRQQVRFLQHQFLQDGNLPFSDILSTELCSPSPRPCCSNCDESLATSIRTRHGWSASWSFCVEAQS
jgi:hypothetical protein